MVAKTQLITLKFYADPGHVWVAVKRKLLNELGIADKIARYSYQKGKTAYLEEDLDLGTLLTALGERGIGVQFKEKHTNRYSPIRNYYRYMA